MMGPGVRKAALTAHVTASVGWMGAVGVFLALGVVAWTSSDASTVRGAYLVMEPLAWYVLLPLAGASLGTGLVQSLGTPWGLLRHYWVVFKLFINVVATVVLVMYLGTLDHFADIAGEHGSLTELREPSVVLHASAAIVLLLGATALSIYKPRGLTPYGSRRKRDDEALAA
jgi:hypothetical protein